MTERIRLVSWNVNSINARLERVQAFCETWRPDILCLQETKCEEENFPAEVFEKLGYYCSVAGQKSYNGVAVLSTAEPSRVDKGFGDGEDDDQARFLRTDVNGIPILNAYVPNGGAVGSEKFDYKLHWLGRLRKYLDRQHGKDEPLALTGDFNVAPEDRDVHDPEAWRDRILFSEPEKAALKNVVDFGLKDTFRLFSQEEGKFSWWDYRMLAFPKNRGLRIDFIFATDPLADRCRTAWIERNERKGKKPSDHAPCVAEFL